eukprot:m.253487 g.253487  ORF g.253487 m.253487 type:complete len:348 (+) comp18391_c0_seq1:265-1308(+)
MMAEQPGPDAVVAVGDGDGAADEDAMFDRGVLIVGATGTGKSTIVNMLFNNDISRESCQSPNQIDNTSQAVTKSMSWTITMEPGRQWLLWDTVGLGDPHMSDYSVITELRSLFTTIRGGGGVTCVIIVAKFNRVSREERANIRALIDLFDKYAFKEQSILLLTNYDGDDVIKADGTVDEAKKQSILQKWTRNDEEMQAIIGEFKQVILTDNSLGRSEAILRPMRKACLDQCNDAIARWHTSLSPKPVSFLDLLRNFLACYFGWLRPKDGPERIKALMSYLQSAETVVLSGSCSICMDRISIRQIVWLNPCGHAFHRACITQGLRGRFTCPLCRRQVNRRPRFRSYKL